MTENLSEQYIIGYGSYMCSEELQGSVCQEALFSPSTMLERFETELETVGSIKHRHLVSATPCLHMGTVSFLTITWKMAVCGIFSW